MSVVGEYGFAKMGENAASIKVDQYEQKFESSSEADPDAMPAKSDVNQAKHKVHVLSKKYGMIKEYLNADGLVFAITWKGHVHPDLSTLLGTYYSDCQKEAKRRRHARRGQGPENIQTSRIRMHRSGHMRSIVGRAICPSLVPKNFDLGSLR